MKNRRSFLSGALSMTAAGLAIPRSVNARTIVPGGPVPKSASDAGPYWSWDEFVAKCTETAKKLVGDRSQAGQDEYLHTLGSLAARLVQLPEVNPRPYRSLNPTYALQPFLYRNEDVPPIIIAFWRMEPGAFFPAHCHPSANVCTLCTGGRGIIRNYDLAPGSPACWSGSDDEFDVVETKVEVLRPGVVNLASEFRNNIHRFEAGNEGMEGIDITTVLASEGKTFSYLRLTNRRMSVSGETIHSGKWVGGNVTSAL